MRLSSPVAEVTISLSKIIKRNDLPRREIKIKPVPVKSVQTSKENEEQTLQNTLTKIEQAKLELQQLEAKKNNLLQQVENEIEQKKAAWEQEKDVLIKQAKEEGFQAGYEDGKRASFEQYKSLLDEANRIVDLVKVDYQKTLEQTEDVIIELAIHTAEKILNQQLKDEPSKFTHIVKTALKEIKDQSVVSIYLHPANYEIVLEQKAELKKMLETDTKLSLYINDELAENSCVIKHPFGEIDASVDTQLEAIRNVLKDLTMEQEQ